MRKRLIFGVILAIGMMALVVLVAYSIAGYSYQSKITIANDSATAWDDRITFTINAKALEDGGYTTNGVDVAIENEYITVMNLTSNAATWIMDYTQIPAYTNAVKIMWLCNGSATRDQVFITSELDNCYAIGTPMLNFTGTATFELAAEVEPVNAPAAGSECFILGKTGVYELLLNGTPSYIFRVYNNNGGTATADQDPDELISNTCDITGVLPGLLSDSNDATYIYEEHTETCVVGLPEPVLNSGLNVGTVTVRIRGEEVGAPLTSTVQPSLRYTGGNWDDGATVNLTGAWAWHDVVFTVDPDGLPWAIENMGDLELKLSLDGQAWAYVSEAYIQIEGTLPGDPTEVTIAATLNSEVPLSGYYIMGTIIGISDGTTTSGGTATAALHANGANIHVGQFDGYINNARVTTP